MGETAQIQDFGWAIRQLKSGERVRRAGWNGKGMHIYLEDMFHIIYDHDKRKRNYGACLVMFTAQGIHQPGWLASQMDILAEDWEIVPVE